MKLRLKNGARATAYSLEAALQEAASRGTLNSDWLGLLGNLSHLLEEERAALAEMARENSKKHGPHF